MTRALSTAGALLLCALCLVPQPVLGHTFPEHADPKVGETVTASPSRVRIWFDTALEPVFSSIMVHDAHGTMVDRKDTRLNPADGKLLEVSIPPLRPGTYRVFWSVLARDGHRTSGDYSFKVK